MSTAEQIIAQHLPEYVDGVGMLVCLGCGEASATDREHAAHVVAALTNAGKTIVELPEGIPDDDGQVWFDEFDVRVDCTGTTRPYEVWVGGRSRSAAGLEHQAAEYLAAARVAEGGA
ncbi:hypothetical protein GTA09_20315 [Rhodococcus hoagii]|nr:hypothetical protein [Prescottella equi]NKZ71857.1 hypothetical protein [Prescottella equi]